MKVNSYTLFGNYNEDGLFIAANMRQHFTMYPDWELWIYLDRELPNTGYCSVLKRAAAEGLIRTIVVPDDGNIIGKRWKCIMMLWRMLPLWEHTEYVFCRDVDSILTPRQLQCVRSFISSGAMVHGINDNQSHIIPLMGGMCGFKTEPFIKAIGNNLNSIIQGTYSEAEWQQHGTDQKFLMNYIWPKVNHSALIHTLNGPNCRSSLKTATDADINDIPEAIRYHGDDFTNYIGAAGCITDNGTFSNWQISNFYNRHGNIGKCAALTKIENEVGYIPSN